MKDANTETETPKNNGRGASIYRISHFTMTLFATAGILWVKVNVPSKEDFKSLQMQVNSVERTVLQIGQTDLRVEQIQKRIDDFEMRIRLLEQKFPMRRPLP